MIDRQGSAADQGRLFTVAHGGLSNYRLDIERGLLPGSHQRQGGLSLVAWKVLVGECFCWGLGPYVALGLTPAAERNDFTWVPRPRSRSRSYFENNFAHLDDDELHHFFPWRRRFWWWRSCRSRGFRCTGTLCIVYFRSEQPANGAALLVFMSKITVAKAFIRDNMGAEADSVVDTICNLQQQYIYSLSVSQQLGHEQRRHMHQ